MTGGAAAGTRTYNAPAKILHWATAVLIAVQLSIGWAMPDVHRGTRPEGLIGLHVMVGVLIVLVVAARVVWRLARPPVGDGPEQGAMKRVVALTHGALYLLMVIVPLLGWANANSRDWVVGLGPLHLPSLVAAGSATGHALGDVHIVLADALAALAGLHVAAGLYHHFVGRDGTLGRML